MDEIIDQYIKSIHEKCPQIDKDTLDFWRKGLTVSELKPKESYIKEGEIQKKMGYIHSGLIRVFYVNDSGDEITTNFVAEKKFASHFTAFRENLPCKFNFQCIEPTKIINFSSEHIEESITQFPLLNIYMRVMLEEMYGYMFSRLEGFLFNSAEQRYLNFIKEYPTLYNRISLTQLSTFLGISRQSLTRIRQKIILT